jgi:NAD(P)-dependent dehydrogenase (short-subunit alcohol dehydrogenase family)
MRRALEGKVAIIMGATSGIGARIAALFIEEGARVTIAGRRRARGEQLARALGEAAVFLQADVCIEADVQATVQHAVDQSGRLDCLVNCAGNATDHSHIANVDLERFDAAMAVHVRGTLAGMKYAVPFMAAQKSGSIINVTSINGTRAGLGGHYYSTAKAATIHLTRSVALEVGEVGIRVNSLSPGPVVTGLFGKGMGMPAEEADDNQEHAEAAIASILSRWQPLPYVGRADDIAQAALFLASDASRLVTGHNLVVDGGVGAGWPIAVTRDDFAQFRGAFQASQSARSG